MRIIATVLSSLLGGLITKLFTAAFLERLLLIVLEYLEAHAKSAITRDVLQAVQDAISGTRADGV